MGKPDGALKPSQGIVGVLNGQEAAERFAAYRWKMILLALFIVANVVFLVLVLAAPARVVAYVFFGYIVLSAAPKFLFGSILFRYKGFTDGNAPDPDRYYDEVACEELIGTVPMHERWRIAARGSADCQMEPQTGKKVAEPAEGESRNRRKKNTRRHATDEDDDLPEDEAKTRKGKHQKATVTRVPQTRLPPLQKTVFVSACVTVHHEDEEGLGAGVYSWECTELPFPPEALQVVFIIDGRRDRAGKIDNLQAKSARFLLARLGRLVGTGKDEDTRRAQEVTSIDDDGLVYVDSKAVVGPVLMEDRTALYKGLINGKAGSIEYILVYKARNGGKRHSHQLYFELCHNNVIARPRDGVLFLDSDVKFAWPGKRESLTKLYNGLMEKEIIGGACGEIEVWKWMKNPITMTQYFEVCFKSILSEAK